jgi:hypothetical protein
VYTGDHDTVARVEPTLAFLPSPLLGAAVWRPVAQIFADRGRSVQTVAWPAGPAPATPADVLRDLLHSLSADTPLVLVPHSNAGLFVPALAAARDVAGCVFVDARLPAAEGAASTAWPGHREFLTRLADTDGLLPPWTRWWDADVSVLFPSDAVQREVEREQRRLPLAYFEQAAPVPPGWDLLPGAYLAFGDTYAAERVDAEGRGWPVATLPGEHLHMLIDPAGVAAALETLLAQIARPLIDEGPAVG